MRITPNSALKAIGLSAALGGLGVLSGAITIQPQAPTEETFTLNQMDSASTAALERGREQGFEQGQKLNCKY